jgi:hypothetical protein
MRTVNLELVKIALERVEGFAFEKFSNAAFAELLGPDFIPLGGHKDWGADAVLSTAGTCKRPNVFFQFSVEENNREKIRNTVARLREVKREVKALYYATSRIVPRLDVVENELGDELGVVVRIRDGAYFASQVNSSPALLAAYDTYLSPAICFLKDLSVSSILADDSANANSAVYVFLRNELEAKELGGAAEGLTDGLIIWALRETGATEGKFMTEQEIIDQIEKDVPGSKPTIRPIISKRLLALSSIPQPEQRPIRHHSKENKFCIAFDLRSKMQDENLQAESLRRKIFVDYRDRILDHDSKTGENDIAIVSRIALRAIQRCLENEGIEFAVFLSGKTEEAIPITKSIDECLVEDGFSKANTDRYRELVEVVLQSAFVTPTADERTFYSRIASVYTILFCLRTEPRLIQYFERMAGHFRFYVGADVLIETLTERFAVAERKVFTNTISLVQSAGGELILTEPVLEEVQHHLYAADQEFKHHYMDCEEAITVENMEIINRPIIRAYFLGKYSNEKHRPRNWHQFINNYCNPRAVNTDAGKEEVRKYLMAELHLLYESRSEVESACRGRDVDGLYRALLPHKKKKELAYNDALMPHLVYARRQQAKENDDLSGFGLKTWWLTNEYAITGLTSELAKKEGASYLMRPDFLLNFLTFLPRKPEAKAIYETLFPTLLGVHLARDHSPAHVERLHKYLEEVKAVEPARRKMLVAQQSDLLKASLRSGSWSESYRARHKSSAASPK